jgi:hypothetical protein
VCSFREQQLSIDENMNDNRRGVKALNSGHLLVAEFDTGWFTAGLVSG